MNQQLADRQKQLEGAEQARQAVEARNPELAQGGVSVLQRLESGRTELRAINGGYRLGYTRVESPDAVVTAPGATPVDVFDDSFVHSARIRAGTKVGTVLPIGIGVGAGYDREDISNLDQRVEDFNARVAVRNPFTGDIGGCVSSLDKGSCLGGVLGSVRSSTFRSRGAMASYGVNLGRIQAGVGGGYDRRKFIAAPGTVLATANGVTDQTYWLSGHLNGRIDERSSFSTNIYANWFQSGGTLSGDASVIGATDAYNRSLPGRLSATAALGIDGINRDDPLEDQWTGSALVGVGYSF